MSDWLHNLPVAWMALDRGEVLEVAGVDELIDVHYVNIGLVGQRPPHELGPDKAGPAGDDNLHVRVRWPSLQLRQ